MDCLELLARVGQVDPADDAVLEAAARGLAEIIGQDTAKARGRRPVPRWRFRLITAVTVTAALSCVAVVAAAGIGHDWLGGPPTGSTASRTRPPAVRPTGSTKAPAHTGSSGREVVASVLTAFSESSDDILAVTKTFRNFGGPLTRTDMWISPVGPAPGSLVRSRVLNLGSGGSRLDDIELSYTFPSAGTAARSDNACHDGIFFMRPKAALLPAPGLAGSMTSISYAERVVYAGPVRVQPATVPSAARTRACLAGGQWRLAARGTLAGQKVIELADTGNGGYTDLWVSTATYLPVRMISVSAPTPYGQQSITFTFRFLPPTRANEALLAPPIPAGFTRRAF
jgi:hypothetical protein